MRRAYVAACVFAANALAAAGLLQRLLQQRAPFSVTGATVNFWTDLLKSTLAKNCLPLP